MNIVVQKFGGTSVGDIEKIKNVSKKVEKELKLGNKVVVVVSAMSGITNKLVGYAKELSLLDNQNSLAEYDSIIASGEQVTSGLLALKMQSKGYKSRSFLGWQIPIEAEGSKAKGKIKEIGNLRKYLDDYDVVVVAGFQAVDLAENRIMTLGRGGSDTSAVAVAAAVQAERCDIYTDVEGVYTTDPRITDKARKLNKVSYEEMLEMAFSGSKVLQTRSVAMAMAHNVRVQVLSTFSNNSGTMLVNNEEIMERRLITGISHSKNDARVTLVNMPDGSGLSAKIFGALSAENINVDMIVQNFSRDGKFIDITFTISREDIKIARNAIEKIKSDIRYDKITIDDSISKISVVGVGMSSNPGVAHTMFKILSENNINIHLISTSEIKISILIKEEYGELATRILHSGYGLDKE